MRVRRPRAGERTGRSTPIGTAPSASLRDAETDLKRREIGGNTDSGAVVPPPRARFSIQRAAKGNVSAPAGHLAMFYAVSNFTSVKRAALFAARVVFGAAVSSSAGGIWGVSDPLCHPPISVPRPVFGGRSRPRCMSLLSGGTALCHCHHRVRRWCRVPYRASFASTANTSVRFCRKTAFI